MDIPISTEGRITRFHTPPNEVALHRGARVNATDGHVGQVGEFMVDPIREKITHLVLCEGHLWGRRDVAIPISLVERVEGDRGHLKVDKHAIEALPAILD
jgi:hypothetical protein